MSGPSAESGGELRSGLPPSAKTGGIWIDQSTRRMDGDRWVCHDCGAEWPRSTVGPPFVADCCRECGGLLSGVYRVHPGSPAGVRSGLPPDGIVAFIRARLDEAHTGAITVERVDWRYPPNTPDAVVWAIDHFAQAAGVLAEVEALRRVVDRHLRVPRYEYADTGEPYDFMCSTDDDDWPCLDVRDLASIWRDHPSWDPAWAPEEART